jgi:hypothetical protein
MTHPQQPTPKYTVCIPFSGFYESIHSDNIDDVEERLCSDDHGEVDSTAAHELYMACDYRKVFLHYAQEYAHDFAIFSEVPSLKFVALDSPREYNFRTDEIICEISEADVLKMFDTTPREELVDCATARHTSRDGFSSFYDPDISTWGDPLEWDQVQLTTLMQAYMEHEHSWYSKGYSEQNIIEDWNGSGCIDNWLCDAVDAAELRGIFDRMYARRDAAEGATA